MILNQSFYYGRQAPKITSHILHGKEPMQLLHPAIKAIIFDMDGTIIQTDALWNQITLATLEAHNVQVQTPQQYAFLEQLSGAGFVQALQALKEYFMIDIELEEFVEKTKKISHQTFEKPVFFVEGFEEFHGLLKAHNIKTGIATNACKDDLQFLSEKLGFARFFGEHVYSIHAVENRAKPDPAIFLHVAQKLGVLPHECLVFEDSQYGFQAARAAGMPCIAVAHARNVVHRQAAHGVIDTYHDAVERIHDVLNKQPILIDDSVETSIT